ncbi:MFS transporter [Runella slithyformis]|uniref:Major facilitator superfamily MFS_1 n=1 Tax=Runella slithyformis (strain ATCC 29530 / DSM 19594 / LMG 11500 / NCIMB 11436 / LSU 4) TaxID=761193 RepID=A0A7U3ZHG9_RUNSL|nr:MFS transporter [Runella slithyformis]AEI47295.1 major facilitator superfamily MFS_1 [Runella slithyformis DSM 19594]
MSQSPKTTLQYLLQVPVLVAALGYLVDMYDLFLFSVVRVPSLKALGVTGDQLLPEGVFLLEMQLAGLLVGGVLWGVLGDKKGRLSVLFGSILLYSLANIANGLITSVPQYAVLRFIAGIGLAGELGAGITLVAEVLPKHLRGYGSMLVATMGVLGGVLAYFVADLFEWRMSYYVGGGLGLVLLVLRVNVFESGLFVNLKNKNIKRGNIGMLFTPQRLGKYLLAILVGVPLWFVVGILITFSPEFGISHGLADPIIAGKAVMLAFTGQTFGDIVSGLLSQRLQSRKKAIGIFILMSFTLMVVYLLAPIQTTAQFYILCVCLGFCNGYWTLFIILAAELFGTNLRATVATSVPNFVRGATIPLASAFVYLKPSLGVINGALVIGSVVVAISLAALYFLEETFTKDMNYEEI